MNEHIKNITDKVAAGATGPLDLWTFAYRTNGGTYMIASDGRSRDSGQHQDLIAILPATLHGTRVYKMWPAVSPELVSALRDALDT